MNGFKSYVVILPTGHNGTYPDPIGTTRNIPNYSGRYTTAGGKMIFLGWTWDTYVSTWPNSSR